MSLSDLRAAVTAAEAALDEAKAHADDAGRAYDLALAALGKEPPPLPLPQEPVSPVRARPTPEQRAAAEALVATQRPIRDAWAAYQKRLAAAQADADRAVTAKASADATATRTTALLAAARAVPTEIAHEQEGALASGHVRITFPVATNRQSRAVVVEVRDPSGAWCPVESASSGLCVLAGAEVQATIRQLAAARLGRVWAALPIGVDDLLLLDGGGTEIDIPAPTVRTLTTPAGTAIGVRS